MDDLLKEAIADAKAVRETALENAKIALEEAFTPRLQSMLSKKIQSEMDVEEQEDEIEDEEEMEDEEAPEEGHKMYRDDDEDSGEEWSEEEPEMEQEEEPEMDMGDEEEEEMPEGVIEINGVMYAPVVSEDDEEEMGDEEEEDDLDLEAILRELEDEEVNEEEEIDENDVSSEVGKSDNHVKADAEDSSKVGAQGPEGEGSDSPAGKENSDDEVVDDLVDHKKGEGEVVSEQAEEDDEEEVEEEIDLEEVIKALSEEEDEVEEANKAEKLQSELDEHRNVVKYLRSKLNEVNLLNAKLLFTNKLFRSFGLSNEQKMKVVENFDRAHNLREVKLVYSTLAESFGSKQTKTEIKESKGSASKPVASTKSEKQEVIAEGHEMRERFKKLAGIL